ncbi:MAG: hypothetical protein CM15mV123_010 [uncultured marine virus]|nr:MAG: hypothetical protein CM15mV123_010 [uncultured marine virus]
MAQDFERNTENAVGTGQRHSELPQMIHSWYNRANVHTAQITVKVYINDGSTTTYS